MKFRADINGLRAVAVIPVLLFHAGIPGMRGGYLGVDIFFVISGFLISKIVIAELCDGTFSMLSFYDRRLRRILPALVLVCLAANAAAPFFMLPYSLKNYGESVMATMLSANNVLLYLTSGYWSIAAEFKPLYHTWSLGVEEQFYLVAPLLLYLCLRRLKLAKPSLFVVLCAIATISLISTWFSRGDKDYAFLMIFTRAWEFSAGAILALLENDQRAPGRFDGWFAATGLFLVVFAYGCPDSLGSNLAVTEAIPVSGTVLIVRYSNEFNLVGRLLSVRPLALLGLSSYSIYLWHQPILACLRLALPAPPGYFLLGLFSLLAVPLGFVSWRYVETVMRDRRLIDDRRFYGFVVPAVVVNLLFGYFAYTSHGFQSFWPVFSYGSNPQAYVDQPRLFRSAAWRQNGLPKVLVGGNSFARDFINILKEHGELKKIDLIYFEGGCVSGQFDNLLKASDAAYYARDWGHALFGSTSVETVARCYRHMKEASPGAAYIVGTKNFGWNDDFVRWTDKRDLPTIRVKPIEGVAEFNAAAVALLGDAYIDVLGEVSDRNGLVPLFTDDGRLITFDTNHLTKYGAKYIGDILFRDGRRFPFAGGQDVKKNGAPN